MNSLYQVGIRNLSDKFTHHRYDRFYERYFEPIRYQYFSLCEIGISKENSVLTWLEYFPNAKIFAIDIDLPLKSPSPRASYIKVDQSNQEQLIQLTQTIPNCLVIIDDGSHEPSHQLLSFNILFTNMLVPGGIYIIEDIETSYWKNASFNIVDVFKSKIGEINAEFTQEPSKSNIDSIFFGQNCIIVTKSNKENQYCLEKPYRFHHCLPKINKNIKFM